MSAMSASIILPTCNRNDDLLNALESIRRQTFKNYEVVIVNDGGEQVGDCLAGRAEMLSGMVCRIVNTTGRLGPSEARNIGLHNAGGDIIFYLDDDDVYYPDHLQIHMEKYSGIDSPDVVYSDAHRGRVVYDAGASPRLDITLPYSNDFDLNKLLVHNYIPILCLSHKRSCIEKSGVFESSLAYLEDWDFLIRLSLNYNFCHIPKTTAMYIEKGSGLSLQEVHQEAYLENLFAVYKRSEKYLADDQERLFAIKDARLRHVGVMANATGRHFEAIGKFDLACTAYSNAVQCDPNAEYYMSLARVQKKLGRHADALCSLNTAKVL